MLDGQPVTPSSLNGQWLLVVVAPSSCGPACEQQLFAQRQLREMLGRERDRHFKKPLLSVGQRSAEFGAPVEETFGFDDEDSSWAEEWKSFMVILGSF